MPQPVDVGSILGGRYKVTTHVTTSADDDLVLDGVDQVLNRGVSILVAGSDNAEQVAASAREIATGERPGHVQVLDLGLADNRTYLITNQTSAADLLDLVVAANPPYVEPFYTDTLGTEIFGQPRSTEPEPYDDRYEPARYEDLQQSSSRQVPEAGARRGPVVPPPPSVPPKSAGQQPQASQDAAAAGSYGAGAGTAGQGANTRRSPQQHEPKVTLWDQDEYTRHDDESNRAAAPAAAAGATAGTAAGTGATRSAGTGAGSSRPASRFPAAARGSGVAYADDEDDHRKKPAFTRWLVGGVLAILLIAAVVLAIGQLGSMFQPTASDNPGSEQNAPQNQGEPQAQDDSAASDSEESSSPSPSPSETRNQGADPVAANVTRLVPDSPDLDAGNDDMLPQTIDGNPVTAWSSLLYANDTFGGFASNMALVVELEQPSQVTEVQLEQLNGSGGSFQILLNDSASLEGAQQVAQGSFTSPSITLPIPEQEGEPRKAQYVLINFTELPQLANSSGPYPWGIKLAEINIS
ncbi:ABC transporter substrate-binding protein [Arthrobacter pigmenti]